MDPQTDFQGALLLGRASAIAKYLLPSWELSNHLPWKEWESAHPDALLEVQATATGNCQRLMSLGRETCALTLLSSSDHVWGWPLARGCCCGVLKTLREPGTFQEPGGIETGQGRNLGSVLGLQSSPGLLWELSPVVDRSVLVATRDVFPLSFCVSCLGTTLSLGGWIRAPSASPAQGSVPAVPRVGIHPGAQHLGTTYQHCSPFSVLS